MGGATALIGDPTGKSVDRPFLSEEEVASNVAGIKRSLATLLDFDTSSSSSRSTAAICVDNADFYRGMSVISFMRDVGRHFRLSSMLAKDSVKSRLAPAEAAPHDASNNTSSSNAASAAAEPAAGMSFTEFSYQAFQGNDFLHLHRTQGAVLQVGGSDQWGNITAGIDLIHRAMGPTAPAHGLTTPLVTTAGGKKFGKSEGNALWLNPELTSHHGLYQYLLNTADADVGRLLRLLTLLPEEEVAAVVTAHEARPDDRHGQRRLAEEVTRAIRGGEGLAAARRAAALLFGGSAAEAGPVTATDLLALAASGDIPSVQLPASELVGKAVIDLAVAVGACPSKGEARRLVKAGGLYLNSVRVEAPDAKVEAHHLLDGAAALLGAGKKKMFVLRAV